MVLSLHILKKQVVKNDASYQSEAKLEQDMITNLISQGYSKLSVKSNSDLYANLKIQIERLNGVTFSPEEWKRFLQEYLDAPNEGMIEKTRKVQENHVYDFIFDDGHIQNIYLWDKKNISRNKLQVINQMKQVGTSSNRYDVTLLVNGLPLVQIELKKRGVAIREAFNQVHRYSKESFNLDHSLYKFVHFFSISIVEQSQLIFASTQSHSALIKYQ